MVRTVPMVPPLEGYQLRLPVFEGPLDVLLRLIEREQLAISEVSLLAVLDQFLLYVRALQSPAPDVIAEFAAVAGRLSLLKSRALLPRPPKPVEDADEPDLVRQLEEYRAVKAAAGLLAGRQQVGTGAFGRGDAVALPEPVVLRPVTQPPAALTFALGRWLSRLPERPIVLPSRGLITLREMTSRILRALQTDRQLAFRRVIDSSDSRHDVAGAFLAMLTLIRRQLIDVSQERLFGEMTLRLVDQPRGHASDAAHR